ncbi:MAG: glycosyltransferase, partial [Bacteroidaceae bacterium]|nr:glycosyltransferase [Bacteroidaceae bacterium]
MPATLLLLISLAISFLSLLGMVTFRWRDYILPYIVFKKQQKAQTAASTNSDGISIIITSYNQAHHLEKNIPILFQQDYPKFEIIIVDESSLDDTKAVIQKLETEFEYLRHTFVPQTSRFISKRKLAITLGIKAAHYPWVVLLEADCTP